jgi:hypothetical protein
MSNPDFKIQCDRHPEYGITNFLCCKKDSRALCPDCLEKEWKQISKLKSPVVTIEHARKKAE